MKRKLLSLFAVLGLAGLAFAAGSYQSGNASGSTSAELIFSADPLRQMRLVSVLATSDKSDAVISLRTGTRSYDIATVNTNTSATNILFTSTSGLASNDVVIIATATTNKTATVWGTSGGTNLLLTAAAGITWSAGDVLYLLGPATSLPLGATSKAYAADALFVANHGRPLRLVVDGTSACTIDSAAVKSE